MYDLFRRWSCILPAGSTKIFLSNMIYSKLLLTDKKCSGIEGRHIQPYEIARVHAVWRLYGGPVTNTSLRSREVFYPLAVWPYWLWPRLGFSGQAFSFTSHIYIALTQPRVERVALGVCGSAVRYQVRFRSFCVGLHYRCLRYDGWTQCIGIFKAPWLHQLPHIFWSILYM